MFSRYTRCKLYVLVISTYCSSVQVHVLLAWYISDSALLGICNLYDLRVNSE